MKSIYLICMLQLFFVSVLALADTESLLSSTLTSDEDSVDDDNNVTLQKNTRHLTKSLPHELIATSSAPEEQKQYYQDRERGWFWYEAHKQPEKKKPRKAPESIPAPAEAKPQLTAKEILREKGKKMEEAMATAMLNPTRENYLEYMRQMNAIQEQSMQFANGFSQVLWSAPEYDRNIQSPSSPQARFVAEQQVGEQKEASLIEISKKMDLYFSLEVIALFATNSLPYWRISQKILDSILCLFH